jgi:hypothetical protein
MLETRPGFVPLMTMIPSGKWSNITANSSALLVRCKLQLLYEAFSLSILMAGRPDPEVFRLNPPGSRFLRLWFIVDSVTYDKISRSRPGNKATSDWLDVAGIAENENGTVEFSL